MEEQIDFKRIAEILITCEQKCINKVEHRQKNGDMERYIDAKLDLEALRKFIRKYQ